MAVYHLDKEKKHCRCLCVCIVYFLRHYSDSSISARFKSRWALYDLSHVLLFTVHCFPFHRASLLPASVIFVEIKTCY